MSLTDVTKRAIMYWIGNGLGKFKLEIPWIVQTLTSVQCICSQFFAFREFARLERNQSFVALEKEPRRFEKSRVTFVNCTKEGQDSNWSLKISRGLID